MVRNGKRVFTRCVLHVIKMKRVPLRYQALLLSFPLLPPSNSRRFPRCKNNLQDTRNLLMNCTIRLEKRKEPEMQIPNSPREYMHTQMQLYALKN